MIIPIANVIIVKYGFVLKAWSSMIPIIVPPTVGTNIRQVVPMAVLNNINAADPSESGALFDFGVRIIYSYCNSLIFICRDPMPRRNQQIKYVRSVINIRTCDSKRRFINQRKAVEAAEYQMLIKNDLELEVYQCDVCFGWHLTRSKNNHTL
jgi:hypothetical protein